MCDETRRAANRPPPVVLVHGNPENALIWGPVIEALERENVVTLSPPGFGAPLSSWFEPSVSGYGRWLVEQLEIFDQPVDLVGHDWGGAHAVWVAINRPDLIRSWASDALNLFAPDYAWHPLARVWQQEGAGEESVAKLFCGPWEQRLTVANQMGITGVLAERVASGFDKDLARAVLSLLRSAVQPVMSNLGFDLEAARRRPGLALIPTADPNASLEMHRWAAHRAGAQIAVLEGVQHWWPEMNPTPGVEALTRFWDQLVPSTNER
jgi:pimeloyl-ACP methyl ester carboxylesterase